MTKRLLLYVGLVCLLAGLRWPAHSSASTGHQNAQLPISVAGERRPASNHRAAPSTTYLPPSCSQVIWDNGPFNNVDGLASEENTFVSSARTADDFALTSSAVIDTITFDIYVDSTYSYTGAVDIYADSGGSGPVNALPLATYASTSFTVVGAGFGYDIRRYTVTLSPPLSLAPGRYWVSGYVIGEGGGRGFFATSNGATPDPGQQGYFRSAYFGFPNWTPTSADIYFPPHFAFTICGESRANVNDQVQLLMYPSGHAALLGCPGYPTRLILTAQLTNLGAATLSDIAIQVRGLGFPNLSNPNQVIVATPNPHRLATADDFSACATGGLAGSLQTTVNGKPPIGSNTPIPALAPGQVTPLFFRVHCPKAQLPIRFLADVLARVDGPASVGRPDLEGQSSRQVVQTLAIEVRRNRAGKLVAEVLGKRATPTVATLSPGQPRPARSGDQR